MRTPFHRSILASAALLALGAGGPLRAEPLQVVVTIPPIHSLAAAVMEGKGEPRLLVKGASSEHTYSMRPSDARALSQADVVVRVSEHLETFLNKPIATLSKKAAVVTLAEAPGMKLLPPREGGAFEAHQHEETAARGDKHDHDHDKAKGAKAAENAKAAEHEEEEYDPHLWLDTANASLIADQLAEAFGKARPEDADAFKANAARLKDKLAALDAELKGTLSGMGEARFIVFHDAYQYFEGRYGVAAAGSITVSPERQPGAARLKAIRAKVEGLKSACVFSEPQFEPKLVSRLVEGTSAKTGTLDGLGAGLPEGQELYFTMMRNLAASLKGCLTS
jgi:zinc transport system substrate-binding protein